MSGQRSEAGGKQEPAPHVIRLQGPWEGPVGRVKLPASWDDALGADRLHATLARRFNRPGSLDADERVFVRVESPHQIVALRLGDAALKLARGRADITGFLEASNRLSVELTRVEGAGGSMLDVAVEIRSARFYLEKESRHDPA